MTRIKELTNGIGADAVLKCVATQESMMQAIRSTRPGGSVGYVGVPHGYSRATNYKDLQIGYNLMIDAIEGAALAMAGQLELNEE